jgi:hypothetical protein
VLNIDRPRRIDGCSGLELAVLCSAITFLRLRLQNTVATFGSLCEVLLNFLSIAVEGLSIKLRSDEPDAFGYPSNFR